MVKKNHFWTAILMACVCIVIGIGLSKIIINDKKEAGKTYDGVSQPQNDEINSQNGGDGSQPKVQKLRDISTVAVVRKRIKGINAKNIKRNLKYLTKITHVGGTPGEEQLGDWIYNRWKRGGFDKVEKKGYDALLSYPPGKNGERNKVEILDFDEEADEYISIFESQPEELGPTVKNENIMQPFIAYAKAGVVTGDPVYVNYCRVDDFVQLLYENITVEGNIAICRFEKIYRGDKAKNAARFGAIGLVLYTEPNFFAAVFNYPTYPYGIYLPDTGIQRGSIALTNGDPQTPGYPASEGIYRTPEEDLDLPSIPVQSISIRDASFILGRMAGNVVEHPLEWQGLLPNITYRYGPGFFNETEKLRLSVYNKNQVRKVYNIIGTIYGRSEPDRYILVGNHRDAWAYGAIDPSGATAIMMEIASVFGSLKKKMNWRPRRTIMFCSWAAEEFALIGSNEFVEDYGRILTTRAVAYLNMDILVQGNYTLAASASPNMKEAMYEAAKMVPDPDGDDISLYEVWKDRQLSNILYGLNKPPPVHSLGAGSDYASFVGQCGISSMNLLYVPDPQLTLYSVYPLYHTVYETFYMVKNLVDPEFIYHRAVGQYYGFLLLSMSNSRILPLNCRDYATDLEYHFHNLNYTHGEAFAKRGIDLTPLTKAIADLTEATKLFHRRLSFIDTSDVLACRRANDQLMMFERAFIDPIGLPGRPFTRNVIYAHSYQDRYTSAKFPGIVDTMFELLNTENPDPKLWITIKKQVSTIVHAIRSAIYTIEPYHVTD